MSKIDWPDEEDLERTVNSVQEGLQKVLAEHCDFKEAPLRGVLITNSAALFLKDLAKFQEEVLLYKCPLVPRITVRFGFRVCRRTFKRTLKKYFKKLYEKSFSDLEANKKRSSIKVVR